jgi:hypothetical protein
MSGTVSEVSPEPTNMGHDYYRLNCRGLHGDNASSTRLMTDKPESDLTGKTVQILVHEVNWRKSSANDGTMECFMNDPGKR